jgi:membrane peptidoglycan carboxypeptidase
MSHERGRYRSPWVPFGEPVARISSNSLRTLARLVVVWVVAGACLAAATVALAPQVSAVFTAGKSTIPDIELDALAQNSRVYDRNGNLMAVLHAEENRSPVTLEQVPDDVSPRSSLSRTRTSTPTAA